MSVNKFTHSGWQGVCLVTVTYVYFLIFAQFAFLRRLSQVGIADAHLKVIMGAMAVGGILASLLAPRISHFPQVPFRLKVSLAVASSAAFLSLLQLNFVAAALVSFLVGSGLGLLTVTLVTHLGEWIGTANPMFVVGAGTGLGYFACNVPWFFNAGSDLQTIAAGVICLAGIGVTCLQPPVVSQQTPSRANRRSSLLQTVFAFTALVWLDSAAFFIIQSAPTLKAQSWQGSAHLWLNASLHLMAALVSAYLLSRGKFTSVLTTAFAFLALACLLLPNPTTALLASMLYPAGVSLYSVALVAYPSFTASATTARERGLIAGWIYSIAGWIGSAMGIGMGQNLGHVPVLFIVVATLIFVAHYAGKLWRTRRREVVFTATVLAAGYLFKLVTNPPSTSAEISQIERGRQVYISEGCIHCHSQYVRPNSADVLMWGPETTIAEIRDEKPPLIGNRRQGPDLSQVGARRSRLWLKMHFFNPAQVSGASIMPSYGFLFGNGRGDDLVAYLSSLRSSHIDAHLAEERLWLPAAESVARADVTRGQMLFNRDCATCHANRGRTRVEWGTAFKRVPVDLLDGTYQQTGIDGGRRLDFAELARIVKFGIPGTDMAGHEYLPDEDVSSIALWLSQRSAQSNQLSMNNSPKENER